MDQRRTYYSTRDLLMMAALAALGGVVSTYVNAVGDFFQSILGFAGTTQWAAGLHVLWLTLAVGLTRKQGAGTITGLLKGGVELLTGNTHGLLVVLVDVVAGLLVDLGFLPFRRKDSLLAYCLAGGLASASNVFVFQLFAAVPTDTLAFQAMLLVGGMATLSGVLFAGVLGWGLLNGLRRAGVVKDQPAPAASMGRRIYPLFLVVIALLAVALTLFLRQALRGPATVQVGGAIETPYEYPTQHGDIPEITGEGRLNEVTRRFTGVPLEEIIARAGPREGAEMVLIEASDGYTFFVSMDELRRNENLALSVQGEGEEASYSVVGAENSKAWVRGVTRLTVVGVARLEVTGALGTPGAYDPDAWQFGMDSTQLDLGDGPRKYQGAPLGAVLRQMEPRAGASAVVIHTEGQAVRLPLEEVLADKDVRLFTAFHGEDVTFALARMDGQVLAYPVTRIEVE
jgi:ABC-type thiamin/hydroxymethylpyrimidine transport system permease subunit/DMSO/TMAO reductase YedYZ molybdopterin-dependent catalytic subunit